MTKAILLTVCILSISGFVYSNEGGPGRAPGMSGEGGHMGPPPKDGPRDQKFELADIKFEYDSKNDLFKNADEAKEFQSLFDKYKTSKEITDHFTKVAEDKKSKMDEMRKSGIRPEFSKMQEEREAEKFNLLKEIKVILEKKKKDHIASLALNEEVKCGGGKNLPVIDKVTTDSMKDASKVAKIILTEEELVKMKKDIKEEVKKEMMKEMADRPKDENRGGGDRPQERNRSRDDEDRPKMAEGKGRKPMPGGGRGRGGDDSSASFSFASQMAGQMGGSQMNMNQMGGSQMNMNQMGGSQMNMNQMGNSQMNSSNQMMMRDQMMQNQIRVPQMNFNQPFQNQMAGNQMNQNQNQVGIGMGQMGQMGNSQISTNQMRRAPMNMNQNQNYGYPSSYTANTYQSNIDQYGMLNAQSSYNLMAPQTDYGYTGYSTMMPAYSGQTNYQYQQSTPSYSQYSFMGY